MSIRVEGKQKRAVATRQVVFDAYCNLAADRIYDEISISAIAKEAGVGKGTVLAHYSEKLALPAQLFADEVHRICDILHAKNTQICANELIQVCTQILRFVFTDDVYGRIILWDGHEVCEQIIGPSEDRFFEVLSPRLPRSDLLDAQMQFELLRALLVNAVVMHRACRNEEDTMQQFKNMVQATLFMGTSKG